MPGINCYVEGLYQLTVRISRLYRKTLRKGRGARGRNGDDTGCVELCRPLNMLLITPDKWHATWFSRLRCLQISMIVAPAAPQGACSATCITKVNRTHLFLCSRVEWVIVISCTGEGRGSKGDCIASEACQARHGTGMDLLKRKKEKGHTYIAGARAR